MTICTGLKNFLITNVQPSTLALTLVLLTVRSLRLGSWCPWSGVGASGFWATGVGRLPFGDSPLPPPRSNVSRRSLQVFVLFREILSTMNWKHEQGCITIAVNVFPFLSHKRISLLLNAPHPDKIALTNVVNRYEFAHFQILRTFLVNFQKA